MKKACFLDRDGVVIQEKNYLSTPEDVELIPGTAEALKLLKSAGYCCIVVSNQSGVARGYYSEDSIKLVHGRIDELLAESGAEIEAYYYCPHHPDGKVEEYTGNCDCRKPEPGMFIQAANEHDIDLGESIMVGDKLSDIRAAENAGCKTAYMVRTGHGEVEISEKDTSGIIIAADILDAVKKFLKET